MGGRYYEPCQNVSGIPGVQEYKLKEAFDYFDKDGNLVRMCPEYQGFRSTSLKKLLIIFTKLEGRYYQLVRMFRKYQELRSTNLKKLLIILTKMGTLSECVRNTRVSGVQA